MTLQEKLLADGWLKRFAYEETIGLSIDNEPRRTIDICMRDADNDLCAAVYDFVEDYINTHTPNNKSTKD